MDVTDGLVEEGGLVLLTSGHGGSPAKVITAQIGAYEKRVVDVGRSFPPQDLVAVSPMIEVAAETGKWLVESR